MELACGMGEESREGEKVGGVNCCRFSDVWFGTPAVYEEGS
jgi:hypothetical protein